MSIPNSLRFSAEAHVDAMGQTELAKDERDRAEAVLKQSRDKFDAANTAEKVALNSFRGAVVEQYGQNSLENPDFQEVVAAHLFASGVSESQAEQSSDILKKISPDGDSTDKVLAMFIGRRMRVNGVAVHPNPFVAVFGGSGDLKNSGYVDNTQGVLGVHSDVSGINPWQYEADDSAWWLTKRDLLVTLNKELIVTDDPDELIQRNCENGVRPAVLVGSEAVIAALSDAQYVPPGPEGLKEQEALLHILGQVALGEKGGFVGKPNPADLQDALRTRLTQKVDHPLNIYAHAMFYDQYKAGGTELNPDFRPDLIARFIDKVIDEMRTDRIDGYIPLNQLMRLNRFDPKHQSLAGYILAFRKEIDLFLAETGFDTIAIADVLFSLDIGLLDRKIVELTSRGSGVPGIIRRNIKRDYKKSIKTQKRAQKALTK